MSSNPRFPFARAIGADLTGWGFFLCTQKDVRQGRTGDLFISLTLQDKTGLIKGDLVEVQENLKPGEQIITNASLFANRPPGS